MDSAYKQIKIEVSPEALDKLGKTKEQVIDSVYAESKIQRTVSQKPLKGGDMVDNRGLQYQYIPDMEELILSPRAAFFLSEESAQPSIIGNLWLILVLKHFKTTF